MFSKKPTLSAVLAEYREKHAPYVEIKKDDLAKAIGFLAALSLPAKPGAEPTAAQQEHGRALVAMRRCKRLLEFIEKYEKV